MARPTLTWQLRHTSSQTWQERRSSGKRGKTDINVAIATYIFRNVARVTFQWKTWQERHSSGKRGKSDVNVARPTLTWQLRRTYSQTWQERRSSGKRGKSDVPVENVARATLSGNVNFFFYKFPLFCDNMDNFVHNAANKTSEFLQYVVREE
jgi:hypothetical protein